MTISAVFFDMGGTIETYTTSREMRLRSAPGMRDILTSAGIDLHLSDEDFLDLIARGMQRYHAWRMDSMEELSPSGVWRDFILAEYPIPEANINAVAEDLMFYYGSRFFHRELRPEVPDVLAAIRPMGLRLGVISNVSSKNLVPVMLRRYGIYDTFDPIVLSCEYGRRKPDPAIFHYAARLANAPTSECVYIGDRINRDILGARRAGYRLAIQITHDYAHGEIDEGAVPDAVITNMGELLAILQAETASQNSQPAGSAAPGRKVKAILFDAGDILYYRPQPNEALRAYITEVTGKYEPVAPEAKKALSAQAFRGWIDQDQYRERVLRLHGLTEPDQIARGKSILIEEEDDIAFFPGVRDTLLALKSAGFYLAVITDTSQPISHKLNWFEKGGFGHVWDAMISSRELQTCKPDPRIYQAALTQLGVTPAEAVFVGHLKSELDGARAVGIHTVAFNYEESAVADIYIQDFAALQSLPLLSE